MMSKLSLLFFTVIDLKPKQIFFRIIRKLHKPKKRPIHELKQRQRSNASIDFLIPCSSSFQEPSTFTFLNQTVDVNKNWNDSALPKLWLYHLHYFDYLFEMSKEGALTWMHRWISGNAFGVGNGWEPYTISMRSVNWIKWLLLHSCSDEKILESLYQQARYLCQSIEYHLLGNHVLANAKALIFLGCFFEGKEPDQWLHKGISMWSEEISEQVFQDGGHFERSPMYHAKILEDVLDINYLLCLFNLPSMQNASLGKILEYLKALTHPDKNIAYFNDSVSHTYHSYETLKNYAQKRGIQLQENTQSMYFAQTGFVRLENKHAVLLADVGSIGPQYIPGHSHAETLSFELSLFGQRVFVNTGVSTYDTNQRRIYERSTKAHNALVIDNANSSQVWQSFRVAKKAEVIQCDVDLSKQTVSATHNGYQKILGDKIHHQRTWELLSDALMINDYISGRGKHEIDIYFHCHPDVLIQSVIESKIVLMYGNQQFDFEFDPKCMVKVIDNDYAVAFGKTTKSKTIRLSYQGKLPVNFNCKLCWQVS